jgi:hypothetical protein
MTGRQHLCRLLPKVPVHQHGTNSAPALVEVPYNFLAGSRTSTTPAPALVEMSCKALVGPMNSTSAPALAEPPYKLLAVQGRGPTPRLPRSQQRRMNHWHSRGTAPRLPRPRECHVDHLLKYLDIKIPGRPGSASQFPTAPFTGAFSDSLRLANRSLATASSSATLATKQDSRDSSR